MVGYVVNIMTLKTIVGIPTYNGYQRVDWLLNSISYRSSDEDGKILQNSKIVICDDSGREDHRQKVREVVQKWIGSGLPVELIINDVNIGVAGSWNRLAKFDESSEYIILINDDIIVSRGWLDSIVYLLDNNPRVGSCSQFCYFITNEDVGILLSGKDTIVTPRDPYKKTPTEIYNHGLEYPGLVMAPAGCFFGMKRSVYNEVGGFDGNYRCFYEESDMGTTLASRGYPTYMLAWPKNWHIWSATFGNAPEINTGIIIENSRKYYTNKWSGHFEVTHPRYMSKIPFQRVKFKFKSEEYEKIIEGKESIDGYYANDEDRRDASKLVRIR